jgi:hypothetical protein
MLPRFTLPARRTAENISLEVKPKQVDAWHARLPLSNTAQAAEEMADYLDILIQTDLAHDVRLKTVEKLGVVVEEIVGSLHEQFSAVLLPLPPRQLHHAELAQRLLIGTADCYKVLALDWLKRRFHLFGGNPVPLYLQRILLAMQAVIEISYETHRPVPENLWSDLHQTFNYALHNGIKDAVPEGGARMVSLEHIYKSCLLLALADPYHFPQVELQWTKDIIARFCNLTSIFPAAESTKGQAGLFVIEVHTDAPPRPLVRELHPMNPRWDLLFNTTELAKHLALVSTLIKGKESLDRLDLPEAARDPAYSSMLRRLKLNWGASLQRQAQRRLSPRGKEFEVCFGLQNLFQSITHLANKNSPLANLEPLPPSVTCMAENDSMGGLSLRNNGRGALQLRVGDVIGLRQANDNTWGVGIVRWLRVPKSNDVHFGVQLLAPAAQAVQVRRAGSNRQFPGLLMQSGPGNKQPMLLVLPGCFAPNQAAEIIAAKNAQSMQISARVESTPSIELYRLGDGEAEAD